MLLQLKPKQPQLSCEGIVWELQMHRMPQLLQEAAVQKQALPAAAVQAACAFTSARSENG